MANLTYFQPGAWGAHAAKDLHFSQAVRVGDFIELSGQGGWNSTTLIIDNPDDEAGQIKQAFENVQSVLFDSSAEQGWGTVFKVRSFHAPLTDDSLKIMVAEMSKFCPNHKPTWTAVGLDKLALKGQRVEIEVTSWVGRPDGKTHGKGHGSACKGGHQG